MSHEPRQDASRWWHIMPAGKSAVKFTALLKGLIPPASAGLRYLSVDIQGIPAIQITGLIDDMLLLHRGLSPVINQMGDMSAISELNMYTVSSLLCGGAVSHGMTVHAAVAEAITVLKAVGMQGYYTAIKDAVFRMEEHRSVMYYRQALVDEAELSFSMEGFDNAD